MKFPFFEASIFQTIEKMVELIYVEGVQPAPNTTNIAKLNDVERLARAQSLYIEFHTQCFWSYDSALNVTQDKIPFVISQLRSFGGRRGYEAAAEIWR